MRTFITSLTLTLTIALFAQVDDMVSLDAGYSDQSFYSLENGEVTNVSNTDWDIAFMSTALNSSILINDNIGTMLYSYGTDPSAWETVDTTGMAWEPLYNSETSWARGAFMQLANEDNVFDYGWGEYNIITHVVTGNRIFIIALSDGSYRKILIEELDLGTYTFKYADLQGTVEVQETISGADYSEKNFWYYSLQTGEVIDREPTADSWDITFTRYNSEIFPGANYLVSGVLQNQEVLASEARTVEIDDAQWTDQPMSEEMNIIGSDWKYFDMDIFQYVIEDSLSYFIQDRDGNVWHLWFTAFDGSGTGDIEFTKQMVSATGVDELGQVDFTVFPNPVLDQAQVVIAVENSPIRYTLLDMKGAVVAQDTWYTGIQHSLDVSALQQGVYLLQVERDGGFGQQRIMVQ